jgi:Flp pilus assembly protein TadG
VLFVFLVLALLALVAMAVDLAYVMQVRAEAQTSADSAALAAAWGLIHPDRAAPVPDATQAIIDARDEALTCAYMNQIARVFPDVDRNDANAVTGEVVVGHLPSWNYPPVYPWNVGGANYLWQFDNTNKYNSVTVRVQRNETRNGPVELYFGKILGLPALNVQAVATAIIEWGQPIGFRPTSETGNPELMPFAYHEPAYEESMDPTSPAYMDEWQFDPGASPRVAGPGTAGDGIPEIEIYPNQIWKEFTESEGEGNFGTIDILDPNNSEADVERQILNGVSEEDLADWNGEFIIPEGGVELEGDPGVSAGIKDELESIIGETRAILLYDEVLDPGNNARFHITGIIGVVILDVDFQGNPKTLTIQPTTHADATVILGGPPVGDTLPSVVRPPRLIH